MRFLNELYDTGINGILNQYATGLKAYVPDGVTRVAFDKNMDKNRYKGEDLTKKRGDDLFQT